MGLNNTLSSDHTILAANPRFSILSRMVQPGNTWDGV